MSLFFLDSTRDFLERFDISRFMRRTDNLDPLTSSFFKDLRSLPGEIRFTVQSEENRPDLISDRVYGTTELWWVVLMYNDAFDVEQFKNGKQLILPTADALDALFFELKSKQTAQAT